MLHQAYFSSLSIVVFKQHIIGLFVYYSSHFHLRLIDEPRLVLQSIIMLVIEYKSLYLVSSFM